MESRGGALPVISMSGASHVVSYVCMSLHLFKVFLHAPNLSELTLCVSLCVHMESHCLVRSCVLSEMWPTAGDEWILGMNFTRTLGFQEKKNAAWTPWRKLTSVCHEAVCTQLFVKRKILYMLKTWNLTCCFS